MRLNICSHGNAPSSVLKQEDQPSWSFRRDSLWLIVTNKVEGHVNTTSSQPNFRLKSELKIVCD